MFTHTKRTRLGRIFIDGTRRTTRLRTRLRRVETVRDSFTALLQRLPNSDRIPKLLRSVDHANLNDNLRFRRVGLLPRISRPFCVRLPVRVHTAKSCRSLTAFIDTISTLPHVIALRSFDVHPLSSDRKPALHVGLLTEACHSTSGKRRP